MQDKTSPRIRKLTQNSSLYSMTKICCKVTAIPETLKSPLMGILARSLHHILGLIVHSQSSSLAKTTPVTASTAILKLLRQKQAIAKLQP